MAPSPKEPTRRHDSRSRRSRLPFAKLVATCDEAVHVRVLVIDIGEWETVGALLQERFARAKPAMTMVEVSRLVDPKHRIEIEVLAVIGSAG